MPEALKNMLLVMASQDILTRDWRVRCLTSYAALCISLITHAAGHGLPGQSHPRLAGALSLLIVCAAATGPCTLQTASVSIKDSAVCTSQLDLPRAQCGALQTSTGAELSSLHLQNWA